jgi:hypothetical protein
MCAHLSGGKDQQPEQVSADHPAGDAEKDVCRDPEAPGFHVSSSQPDVAPITRKIRKIVKFMVSPSLRRMGLALKPEHHGTAGAWQRLRYGAPE